MKNRSNGGETAVFLLFGDEPADGCFQIVFIDVNVAAGSSKWFDDKGRKPQTALWVAFAKRRIRSVVVSISKFSLVTCD